MTSQDITDAPIVAKEEKEEVFRIEAKNIINPNRFAFAVYDATKENQLFSIPPVAPTLELKQEDEVEGTFEHRGLKWKITSTPTYGEIKGLAEVRKNMTSAEKETAIVGNTVTCPELVKTWEGPVICADTGVKSVRTSTGALLGTTNVILYKKIEKESPKKNLKKKASLLASTKNIEIKRIVSTLKHDCTIYSGEDKLWICPDAEVNAVEKVGKDGEFVYKDNTVSMNEPSEYIGLTDLTALKAQIGEDKEGVAVIANAITGPFLCKALDVMVVGPSSAPSNMIKDKDGNILGVKSFVLYEKEEYDAMDIVEEEKKEDKKEEKTEEKKEDNEDKEEDEEDEDQDEEKEEDEDDDQ